MDEPLLFDFPEAAARLGVKESWLRRAVSAKQVPHRRLGKRVMFSKEDVDRIVAQAGVQVASIDPRRGMVPSRRRKR